MDRVQAVAKFTVANAVEHGCLISQLNRERRPELMAALIREVASLCKVVDAKRTISTDEELIETVQAIVDGFPTLRLEEFALVCRDIRQGKYGKFYERLKMAEILDAVRKYESGPRCDYLEHRHRQQYQSSTQSEARRGPVEIKYEPPKKNPPRLSGLTQEEVVQIEELRGVFIPAEQRRNPEDVLREAEEASSLSSTTELSPNQSKAKNDISSGFDTNNNQ